MKIRFFSSFCDASGISAIYKRLHRLESKDYEFTNEEDYTHAVILNIAMPALSIPKEHVIGLAFEPPQYLGLTTEFLEYAKLHIGTYYIGELHGLPPPFTEGFGCLWHTTPPQRSEIPKHDKFMSLMISDKISAPGHKYRHILAMAILATDLPIDIYGRGCRYYKEVDQRIKGEFNDIEPYVGYKYHIAIENFQTPHYFSEKVINPLLYECQPVYLGCHNIIDYFDDMVIRLSGDLERDMTMIKMLSQTAKTIEIDNGDVLKIVSFERVIAGFRARTAVLSKTRRI
jgi:hypothetical protein